MIFKSILFLIFVLELRVHCFHDYDDSERGRPSSPKVDSQMEKWADRHALQEAVYMTSGLEDDNDYGGDEEGFGEEEEDYDNHEEEDNDFDDNGDEEGIGGEEPSYDFDDNDGEDITSDEEDNDYDDEEEPYMMPEVSKKQEPNYYSSPATMRRRKKLGDSVSRMPSKFRPDLEKRRYSNPKRLIRKPYYGKKAFDKRGKYDNEPPMTPHYGGSNNRGKQRNFEDYDYEDGNQRQISNFADEEEGVKTRAAPIEQREKRADNTANKAAKDALNGLP